MDTQTLVLNETVSESLSHSALTGADSACIQEIADVLKKHNCHDRYGLTLLHRHFDLEEDEVLAETNNPLCRTLLVEPMALEELQHINHYETAWRFDQDKPITTCVCLAE